MTSAITSGAVIRCSHQGTVSPVATQQKLKVDGQPVLLRTDLVGAPVSACTNQPTPANPSFKPCTSTVSVLSGAGTTLSVGGTAVLLDNAQGATDSVPPGTWSVQSPGQTKLGAS